MDETEARQRLERMVSVSSEPALTTPEVDDLLAAARRIDPQCNAPTNVDTAPEWAPATAYLIGDVVTADPAVGRWWRCTAAGTSAAAQPVWPDLSTSPGPYGARISDGPVLVWEDAGTAWSPTWDLHAAAAEGWELKASKAAGRFDFTTDGQTFRRGQIISHCQQMARTHRRRVMVNAPAVGA
jgi:hypothetical protein